MVSNGPVWSCMVWYCPVRFCRILFGLVRFSMVLHEISNNYVNQQEITHNIIRKLEENKIALNSNFYHDIAKDDTRYPMLDSMLYHKIAIDSFFSNKLYPCAPIVCLVIFICDFAWLASPKLKYFPPFSRYWGHHLDFVISFWDEGVVLIFRFSQM